MPPQPSPRSLSPHALPAGSVGCQSPQVSSSHPDSALTLESRCNQLYQWKWGREIAVGNGKKGLRGFGTPCIHFRTPHGNVSGVWRWQNGGKNRNTGHDSLAPRFSGIRYSHTRQEPSAPIGGGSCSICRSGTSRCLQERALQVLYRLTQVPSPSWPSLS